MNGFYYMPMPQPFDGWTKKDFISEINKLQNMNYSLYKENKRLNSQSDIVVQKPLNERRAGRKPRLDKFMYDMIVIAREHGESIRDIARKRNISVGLVHKALSLPNADDLP